MDWGEITGACCVGCIILIENTVAVVVSGLSDCRFRALLQVSVREAVSGTVTELQHTAAWPA